ncbi:phosphoglycerate kinase [Nematocida major]|uniref:phosphoglycerate kinase n=1 Tax=Nematocida major TaxID=1912982 RepID=UPI002007AFB1|nr:phosphoglycerate kinase [Nematocida major]KAH9387091.1 phosphoglycerate kinase [Nematocida major]
MKAWTHEVYSGKKALDDVDVRGKRIFLRVDYNVPIVDGAIIDNAKIAKSIPTIHFLLREGAASIVIGSHLGRPACDEDPESSPQDRSMLPVLQELNQCLAREGVPVQFVFEHMKRAKTHNKWVLVQNLRSLKVEKDRCDKKSKALFDSFIRENCDLMVNDAFAVLHRADYSVVDVNLEKVAGTLIDSEMQGISLLLGKTKPIQDHSPLNSVNKREIEKFIRVGKDTKNFQAQENKPIDLLIIGGCKLEDKIQLVKNLAKIASNIFLGGLLAVPLLQRPIAPQTESLIESIIYEGVSLFYPADYVLDDQTVICEKKACESTGRIKDIGPETEEKLKELISQSKCIFWNGTLGQAEIKEFSHGTNAALEAIRRRKHALVEKGERTMICAGGGDTGGYINANGHADSFDLVFTGGGATLSALQGDILPGVQALSDRK